MLFLPVIGRLEPETPPPRSKNMQLGALQQRVLSIRKALNRLGAGVLSNHLLLLPRITILNDSKKLLEVKVGGCPSLHYLNEAMLRGTVVTCTTAAVELVEHSIRRFHSVNIVLKKRWRAMPAGNPVRDPELLERNVNFLQPSTKCHFVWDFRSTPLRDSHSDTSTGFTIDTDLLVIHPMTRICGIQELIILIWLGLPKF